MRIIGTLAASIGLSSIALMPTIGQSQSAPAVPTADAILSRPISPGTVALLVEHGTRPAVPARLAEALGHSDPHVRAAAARVIFVLGLRQLVPAAAAALEAETDTRAATEEARIVAYFGTAVQADAVLQRISRLEPEKALPVALVVAAARGMAALDQLNAWRKTIANEAAVADFIRLATRGESDAFKEFVSGVVRSQDVTLLTATLRAAREADTPTDDLLVSALAPGSSNALREVAIRYFLATWNGRQPIPDGLRAAITAVLAMPPTRSDAGATVTREMASRATGQAPRTDPEWTSLIGAPPVDLRTVFALPSVRALLTDRELETVSRVLFSNLSGLLRPNDKDVTAPARGSETDLLVRTASGYPPGFLPGLFAEAGCDLGSPRNTGTGASGADITMRNDGRPLRLSLVETQAAPGCAYAARVALMTYTADIRRLIRQDQRDLVILPFDADFVRCQESSAIPYVSAAQAIGQGRIEPPRKTKDVRPVYPQAAITERVQGTVIVEAIISPTGCVSHAHVVRSIDPRLDWAAARAVIGWKFSPTLLGGLPVPVIMTVTVQFSLK